MFVVLWNRYILVVYEYYYNNISKQGIIVKVQPAWPVLVESWLYRTRYKKLRTKSKFPFLFATLKCYAVWCSLDDNHDDTAFSFNRSFFLLHMLCKQFSSRKLPRSRKFSHYWQIWQLGWCNQFPLLSLVFLIESGVECWYCSCGADWKKGIIWLLRNKQKKMQENPVPI